MEFMMEENARLSGISVSELLKIDKEQNSILDLTVVSGQEGFLKKILREEINRPGLSLAGFFDCFAYDRIQIFGRGEVAYLEKLIKDGNTANIEKFFQYDMPVCIATHNYEIPKEVIDLSNRFGIPFLRTKQSTKRLIALLSTILADVFAPFVTFHADFVSIYNIGVLITGKSGIGKSENVLGLLERGHKFICDDMVKVKKIRTPGGFELKGESSVNLGPFIEIRGIGIVNLSQYFGEERILKSERLSLIIDLQEWNKSYNYDRLGLDEMYENVLGVDVPKREIPVSPGRNIPLLVEVAAYREIMRRLGYNAADDLDKKIKDLIQKKEKEVV
jgi:HPr kinase/phosphorylase